MTQFTKYHKLPKYFRNWAISKGATTFTQFEYITPAQSFGGLGEYWFVVDHKEYTGTISDLKKKLNK